MPTLILAAAPPTVWMAYFLVVYIFEIMACKFVLGSGPVLAVGLGATTLALGGLALLAGLAWRRKATLPAGGTEAWLARISLLLCVTTAVATVWVGLPLLLVPGCL